MKTKTINKTLTSIHKSLCESITDPKVKELVEKNTIITGGCITSMLLQEKVNDYDMYFRDKETAFVVAQYYVDRLQALRRENKQEEEKKLWVEDHDGRIRIVNKSKGIAVVTDEGYKYFENSPDETEAIEYVETIFEQLKNQGGKRYQPMLLTGNSITLSGKIQLVIRFYGDPEEIHKNYDFVHATNYWTSWDKKVFTNTAALECILARELRYIGSLYPLCSMMRLRKFLKRGWSIHAGHLLKIAFQIADLNLHDLNVLEEQLTGVDFAYFIEVIAIIKGDLSEGKEIDSTYLAEVVDRVFDV